jgi:hypothetical protein
VIMMKMNMAGVVAMLMVVIAKVVGRSECLRQNLKL